MSETDATPPLSLGLTGYDHLTLIVADLEASRTFYGEQLGFREVTRPAFDFPGAWFELGGTMIHLTLSDPQSGTPGWADRAVQCISRGHHFAYVTTDFDRALQAIAHHGIPVADGPKTRPDGARQVYLYDPDRHLIEICTPPGTAPDPGAA